MWAEYSGFRVSDSGEVRSNGRELKQYDSNGYKQVVIHGKHFYVHRLVATAFIPNPESKPQVNHKDGTTPQSLAKQMQVHVNTVYSDLRDPDRIPQNRLWLYFTVLGIPVDDALQRIADSFSRMLVER